jgi:hypothetical protein
MNQQTRALYDTNIANTKNVIAQKSVKYMTNALSNDRSPFNSPHPESIDISSTLRMKPTRLNYFNRPEGELYGTAPMGARDTRPVVDVESFLRNSESFIKENNRTLTERTWNRQEFITVPLAVDSIRPTSTRANLRNDYCNTGNRSFDPNTHHNKSFK